MQTQKRTYINLIDNISEVLNSKYKTKEDKELFISCLRELKEEYKTEISTKFLKSFYEFSLSNKEKTYLMRNFLSSLGLKLERKIRFFSSLGNQTYKAEIIDYCIGKDGKVFIKDCKDQEIGNFIKEFKKEVLYFIKGF
jgi:hypothetical protein